MSVLFKQSAVIAAGGLAMLVFVGRLVRRRKLSFHFATGWVAVSIAVIAASLLTRFVNPIANWFHMTGTAVFLLVAVAFVIAVCIQLSVSVSGMHEKIRDLSEDNALLRAELDRRVPTDDAEGAERGRR
jgi:hypothetical protein